MNIKYDKYFDELLINMIEGVAIHQMIFDENGKPIDYIILKINKEYEKILGISKKNVENKLASEIYGEILLLDVYSTVVAEKIPKKIIFYYPKLDKHFNISVAPWNDIGFITIFSDITEKMLNENKITNTRNLLTKSQEIGKIGSWYYDMKNNTLEWTDECYKIFGIDKNIKMNYEKIMKHVHPDDVDYVEKEWQEKSKINNYDIEHRIIVDGKIKWVREKSETIYNDNNEPIKAVGMVQDITEQKESQEKIKNQKNIFEKYLEIVNSIIISLDEKGRITLLNEKGHKIIGYEKDELIGRDWFSTCLPKEEKDAVRNYFDKLITGGIVENDVYENTIIKKNGEKRLIRWYNTLLIDELGKINGLLSSGEDITEQKKTEIKLIKAKEKAEESERLKTSFLASMSHEIRTPMNGIIGFADLLKENNINEEDQKNYIEIIKKSGKRMLNILNNIISISKIDAGVEKVNNDATDINSLLKYIYDFFKIEVENKGLKLILNEKLEKENSLVLTDKEKIYSILINLVKNSIKYSDKGKICFGCNKVDNNLIFYVKDHGIGIPKKYRETIFNIFTQLKNSDGRKEGGIGLGLTISKKYVEMLGGRIWLDKETKKGTKFYFSVPYVKVDDIEDEMEEKLEYTKILKNKKFLIVENDETSMLLLSTIIKKYGGKVIKTYNGLDAIDICKRNNDIDLIFMDIHMPEINGYETTKKIRLFNNDVIIIAQTAYALEGDESLAKTSGCNEYISKPISIEDVRNIIEKYLNVKF